MTYFNSHTYKINISAAQALQYLQKITAPQKKRLGFKKHQKFLFKGWIKQNQFHIKSDFYSEILVIEGRIEAADKEHSYMHLSGRFLWIQLVFNAFILLFTTLTLSGLSFLLLSENALYGSTAIAATLFICWRLYLNLFGQIKKNYDKMSLEIIDLLTRSKP